MRMFAPTFLFGAICRFLPEYSWCPEGVSQIAWSCPSFLTSDFGLCVFGVLGALEVIANWDDSVRELISESNIDTYVKPVFAMLMTYSILPPEQTKVMTAVAASPDAIAVSNAVAGVVGGMAQGAVETARSDPGSSFSAIVASLFFCGCRLMAELSCVLFSERHFRCRYNGQRKWFLA